METQNTRSAGRRFGYTPASIFTIQLSNLAFGLGMVVVPLVFPFGVRIRRLQILSPAVFSTILILGGALLLLFTFLGMRKARALKAEGGSISVDGDRVTYPEVCKGRVRYDSFLISDIERIKDDDDQSQCRITLPDRHIVLETDYFDSAEEYAAFRSLLG